MKRRSVWMAGLAAAAGAAGVGAALWRQQAQSEMPSTATAFWRRGFDGPHNERIELADFRGRPLLVNFWATWCPPCVEELPLLNAFYQAHAAQGWQVLGLAVDQVEAVRGFMGKLPLAFPVGMAGFAGIELSRELGNPNGGLPFTVVFGSDGAVQHRRVGQVTADDLALWVQGA